MEKRRIGEIPTLETKSESNESVDRTKRYKQIVEILKGYPNGLTAKEIAILMYSNKQIPIPERNFTAPRLTELSKKGIVEPIGKKTCQYTRKTVAVYSLRPIEGQMNIYEYL